MFDSKLCLIVVLGGNVDVSFPMDMIHLKEHGGIRALKISKRRELKSALLCYNRIS